MDKRQPSLVTLQAFEATVRLNSMTAAAAELGISQSAVSQRIYQLEEQLGAILIRRSKQGSRATTRGRLYYDNIIGPLQQLETATAKLRQQARTEARRHRVVIAVHFGFAYYWLLPRLEQLKAAFPAIDFQVLPVAEDHVRDADLLIRFACFHAAGPHDVRLMSEQVYPVCSPALAARYEVAGSLHGIDTNRLPLLHLDERDPRWLDWPRWIRMVNLAPLQQPARFQYKNYPLLINAAIEGRGIALAWHGLTEQLVADRQLQALGPSVQRPEFGYLASIVSTHGTGLQAVLRWLATHATGISPA